MASTSSSSIQKSFKYDVFLSFRGDDTRKTFVDHLYNALKQKGIYTYKDDEEIKKGKRISDEVIRSIEDSKSYIIVFSKNYASSSWCLDELVKIMECQKTIEQTAYPVFYDVEPSEVRKQCGAVGEAFAKHKGEVARKWREALREAANLTGWELKTTLDGHEAKFILKIVEEISLGIDFINSRVDGKLIGMETRVKDVLSYLELGIDDVRMIGIKGMGGGGKTTLARAVFDQISFQFECSSFLENVRETSKNPLCGLKLLQKQVLSDVLRDSHIKINGVSNLKNVMKKMMCGRKVLVVLDDVDHINQLEALAGEPSWFESGSRVIITTREEQVLVAHGVPKNLILDVSLLSPQEANCLFNRYAFGTEIPNQGYEKLSGEVVRYAAGLPLTIKVLGSFLCGKDELEWIDALERLKTIPLKETMEILELSYNSLEEDYKEIFLNVACLLKGWEKEKAVRALESCGYHARNGLRVLEQKSLITVYSVVVIDNILDKGKNTAFLTMHDHIEELGKNIVRRLHPNEPYKHSKLWIKEEIEDIFVENKGTKSTRFIKIELIHPVILTKGLRKMKELRFLEVNDRRKVGPHRYPTNNYDHAYDDIDEDTLYLPKGLQYLRWDGYPFTCLPKNFHANNLVGFEMCFSNINQLWDGDVEKKVLKKLRFIDFHSCNLRTLDIGLIPNLERLILTDCWNLVEVNMPVESCKLKYLGINNCKMRTLDIVHAKDLDTLYIKKCVNLVEIHMPGENPKLKHLSLSVTKMKTLNLRWAQSLEMLDLACKNLEELHMPIESSKLKYINLNCSKLRTLDLGQFENLENLIILEYENMVEFTLATEKLKQLYLGRCYKLKTLNLMWTRNLEMLDLVHCEDLIEVHMPVESHELKICRVSGSKLRTLNLTQTRNLEELNLVQCDNLEELHMPTESHELKIINIHCSKLRTLNLTWASNLETLHFVKCEDLLEIHMPDESPKLKSINLCCSKLKTLYVRLSPYLECLDLTGCFNLVEIHANVGGLSGCVRFKPFLANQGFPMVGSLAELHLIARPLSICPLHASNNILKFHFEYTYKELLPTSNRNLEKLISSILCACTNLESLSGSICDLQCLRKLTLEGSIPEVPKEIDRLDFLEEFTLVSTKIEHLPDTICKLKHLKLLQLKSCWFLRRLPEDLDRLEYLEELRLTDCTSIRDIPNSICEMKRLKCLHLKNCILVEKLPKEIGGLKCLKELNIEGTCIRDFPPSLFELEDLLFLL